MAKQAAIGLSWTPDRAGAAWWASGLLQARGYSPSAAPIVLRRVVKRDDVLLYVPRNDATQRIDEMVLAPGPATVDGTPDEWRALAAEWQSRHLAEAGWRE